MSDDIEEMPDESQYCDLQEVAGVFARSNLSLPAEEFTDHHRRNFFRYLHSSDSPSLKRQFKVARTGGSKRSTDALERSSMFGRVIRLFIFFIRTRWRVWLDRNCGLHLHDLFFLFSCPLPFPPMLVRLPVARLDAGLAADCRGYHSSRGAEIDGGHHRKKLIHNP